MSSAPRSKSSETRATILDAAWRLLESHGAGTSLEQVAAAAGVSRQAGLAEMTWLPARHYSRHAVA
ncbi:MAG: TetR family transcriptional regulator [Deltaproteobacteria bacterium]